jgi:hypothetical protein
VAADPLQPTTSARDHAMVLELRLRTGTVVTFDGRVVEVFAGEGGSARLHVSQLTDPAVADGENGERVVTLRPSSVVLRFAASEAHARRRLLAALDEARAADARLSA